MRETPKGIRVLHGSSSGTSAGLQRQRAFLVVAHVDDAEGRPRPSEGVSRCPQSKATERCRLSKHHERERKTGPCFPLWVMRCATHRVHFTLYPSGHVPYGRERVAPVTLAGLPGPDSHGGEAWRGTFFPWGIRCRRWPDLGARYGGLDLSESTLRHPAAVGRHGGPAAGAPSRE